MSGADMERPRTVVVGDTGRKDSDVSDSQSTRSIISFSTRQYENAQGLPKMATERVVCAVLGVKTVIWRWWRSQGWTPEGHALVSGNVAYMKRDVLGFVRSHLREAEQ